MLEPAIQATVVPAPFGRVRIVVQIGVTLYNHAMIFGKEHAERAQRFAAALTTHLQQAEDPFSVLNFEHWEGPGARTDSKRTLFKPKSA